MSAEESGSNREQIVARLYNDGWARGDFDVVFEILDPAVVWTAIEGAPDAGEYRGFESVRRYMQDWLDDFDFEGGGNSIEESVEAGDRLVCVQRVTGTGRGSEIQSEIRYACVYTFGNDERIVQVNEYATREEALKAASEPSERTPGSLAGSKRGDRAESAPDAEGSREYAHDNRGASP